MGRSQETSNKKDREKKKDQKKKDKEYKRQERKSSSMKGQPLEAMFAYVDEFGRLTSTPPDQQKRTEIKEEDIEIGVPRRADLPPEEIMRKGVVTFFNDSKGYGFIRDLDSQASLFVHINAVSFQLKENDKVTFEIEMGQKGPMAVRVNSAV